MSAKKKETGLLLAYPIIWALSIAIFWLFMSGADAMGYSILFIWILNPAAVFIVSFMLGKRTPRGARTYAIPVFMGVLYALLPYSTFSLANTLTSGNFHAPDVRMLLAGMLLSALGLLLGFLFSKATGRIGSRRQHAPHE